MARTASWMAAVRMQGGRGCSCWNWPAGRDGRHVPFPPASLPLHSRLRPTMQLGASRQAASSFAAPTAPTLSMLSAPAMVRARRRSGPGGARPQTHRAGLAGRRRAAPAQPRARAARPPQPACLHVAPLPATHVAAGLRDVPGPEGSDWTCWFCLERQERERQAPGGLQRPGGGSALPPIVPFQHPTSKVRGWAAASLGCTAEAAGGVSPRSCRGWPTASSPARNLPCPACLPCSCLCARETR